MLILFDLDDTLLDHQSASHTAAIDLHKNIGATKPLSDFLIAWEAAQERHYARYYAGEISFEEQRRERLREVIDPTLSGEAADLIFVRHFEVYERSWSLFPDVLPCLNRLSHHRLGLISNGDDSLQRRKLEKAGITDRFDCIVISSECGYTKPDVRIFQHACDLAGEKSGNAIYIGDRYDIDAQASRHAGLQGVWLDRKGSASPEHEPPVIVSLDDLSL